MASEPVFAWAAVRPNGQIFPGAVRRSRREIIDLIPQFGIGANDYERLGPKRAYRKCYERGWRCIRVKVIPAFMGRP